MNFQPVSSFVPEFSRDWALFLDVDGTLIDFAPRPDQVSVSKELVVILDDLKAYIAVSIADNREKNASLFIEDAGLWNRNDDEKELAAYLDGHRKSVAESIVACGNNQNVIYERTYVGYAYTMLEPGEIGTALAVSPYIVLAKNAVPKNGFSDLQHKTLSQWERMMDL